MLNIQKWSWFPFVSWRCTIPDKLLQCLKFPLTFNHGTPIDTFPSPKNFAVFEISLVNNATGEEQFAPSIHLSSAELSLVLLPKSWLLLGIIGVVESPAIGLILSPFALVLHFSIGKVEHSLSMHHIVLPLSLIIASILEYVLALAVLQAILLLADILVAICVLLVNILILLVLWLWNDDVGGEDAVGWLRAPGRVYWPWSRSRSTISQGLAVIFNVLGVIFFDYTQSEGRATYCWLSEHVGNTRLQLCECASFKWVKLQHIK